MALSVSHRPPPPGKPLDASLRGFLASNADIVTRITKRVQMADIGALSAQSDQPIVFENIVEKPGFTTRQTGQSCRSPSTRTRTLHPTSPP